MEITGVNAVEIEHVLIGELWLEERNIYVPSLQENLFSDPLCRRLVGLLKKYNIRNDIFSLENRLSIDGILDAKTLCVSLTMFATKSVSIVLLPNHIQMLQQIQSRNRIIELIENSQDRLTESNIKEIHKITAPIGTRTYSPKTLKDLCLNFTGEYEKRIETYKNGVPYPTGFSEIDNKIGGILLGNITLVGGRTSYGKTALMTNIAVNIAEKGIPVLYLSCEMEAYELFDRVIAARTRIEACKIKFARLSDISEIHTSLVSNNFFEKPLTICYTPGLTVPAIQKLIEEIKPKILFIDHVQIMRFNNSITRAQAMEEAAYELKDLSGEYDIGIVLGSQINREAVKGGHNTKMTPAYYKGSGGLEDSAGVAMEIKMSDGENKENTEWIMDIEVQKARFGPVGTIRLKFERQFARFSPYNF